MDGMSAHLLPGHGKARPCDTKKSRQCENDFMPPIFQEPQNKKTRSHLSLLFGLTTALAIFVALGTIRGENAGAPLWSTLRAFDDSAEEPPPSVPHFSGSISNQYSVMNGRPGLMYPWLSDKFLVEPYIMSTLTVRSSISLQEDPIWYKDGDVVGSGTSVEHMFTALTTHNMKVEIWMKGINSSRVLHVVNMTAVCRYVRRELRTLGVADRDAFFNAARIMWTVDLKLGKEMYGEEFRPVHHFVQMHTELSGARECDHMHDGLGFMTQHTAITALFERALQVVNPAVSLPYWDFTIDGQHVYDVYDGNFSYLFRSEVFGADWFGNASNSLHTVTEGNWAYTRVPSEPEVEIQDYEKSLVNAYGFLRAPWNTLKSPFVTRIQHDMCGASPETILTFPACEEHFAALTEYNTWYDFAWNLPYTPHGPVHAFIGGNTGCTSTFDKLVNEVGIPAPLVTKMRLFAFTYLKNLWRESTELFQCPYYCSMDTPQDDCKCWCTRRESENLGWWKVYEEHICITMPSDDDGVSGIDCSNLTVTQKRRMVELICDNGIALDGDHLEASSPSDVSFWPIHPTMERLWQLKKLSGTFKSEVWPDRFAQQRATLWDDCYGHFASDELIFKQPFGNGPKKFTNKQLYNYMDPHKDHLPYIYDHFEWDHCSNRGYNFSVDAWR